jgi:hypothetical protein
MISLRLVLQQEQAEAWPCTLITPDPEDECFICKEPFTTDPSSEACRAIRLSCGHLVGHRCFADWLRRQPKTCPLLSHPLHPQQAADCDAKPCREPPRKVVLRWLVNTWLFERCDDIMNELTPDIVGEEEGQAEFGRRIPILAGQSLSHASALKSLKTVILMCGKVTLYLWWVSALMATVLCICHSVFELIYYESARNGTYLLGQFSAYFATILRCFLILANIFGCYALLNAWLLGEAVARGQDQDQDSGPSFREENGQLFLVV